MEREKDIKRLFQKFKDNSITRDEYQVLMDWIGTSGADSKLRKWMDEHWEELKKNGISPERESEPSQRFSRLVTRKEIRRASQRNRRWGAMYRHMAVAAVIVVLLGVASLWYFDVLKEAETPPVLITQSIAPGKKATIVLPDGTQVRLNSNSEITFPERFEGATREVSLRGEAFFEVTKDKTHPFIIKTGALETRVLGTSFNIMAYEGREGVEVSVATGKVSVKRRLPETLDGQRQQEVLLYPSEQVVYHPGSEEFVKSSIPADSIALWKDGILSFNRVSLEDAAVILEHWYGKKVILKNPALKHCIIRGKHKNESLANVLHSMQYALGIRYEIREDEVIIDGKGCQ
ncbi:FecR family protein [Sinomicrobium soli]|uniref:FecR family protein n=1 Tax=Sinomicrobium sp. N-1-3-6 TaxID=2219864 RepID=UPI001374C1B9|nr:FecR family protein [Sinomicrobium sp. N-1-3-6]